ncbi:HDIG domain-containing metalloprotein [Konateibacter massiliensis]|uniref:HDIG domain-containing metalloprotein n=1 Tax=Konateibacter massiliensis TaxID=2002841 RepID=UPI000C1549A1|nr:HDIG domain-containing metalloprotein [Konateibacter massiliensis]
MKDKYNHTPTYYSVMTFLMYFVTIALIGVASLLKGKSWGELVANILISIVFITIIVFYLTKQRLQKTNFTKLLSCYGRIINVYWILFVVSFVLTFVPSDIRPMFIVGIIMTLVSDEFLGVLFQIYLSVMMTLISADSIEALAFYLVSGLIGCAVAKYFSQKKNILYASFVVLTANLAVTGVLEYLKNETVDSKYIISSLICTFGGIVIIVLSMPYIYYRVDNKLKTKLLRITDTDYELLVMLKNYSKDLYDHSYRVAKLSERVAYKIGADSLLAKAGGYYHKIGKLEGKDFINHGVDIARSYAFPDEVVDIIKQHTGRSQSPKSTEAAIVMLSDNIITAFEYLEDKQNELVFDKDMVIDQVVDAKLEKNALDDSGLTLKMFRDIKKCFKQEENIYDI